MMKQIITGQVFLILCCAVYLVWWYRGFRPGVHVSRAGGINGILLLITAVLGFVGIVFSLMPAKEIRKPLIGQGMIVICGIAAYVILLVLTRVLFNRIVTTELFLIVGWTMLETIVADRLYAIGSLGHYCNCLPDRHRSVCGVLPNGRNEGILRSYGPAGSRRSRYGGNDRNCT